MKRILSAVVACGCFGTIAAAPVPPLGKFLLVDLQPKANVKLTDNLGAGNEGTDLAELPTGEQTFNKVPFKVGPGLIQLGSKGVHKMPSKVEGIVVGGFAAKVHLLHATCYGGGASRAGTKWYVEDDTPIGEYRVNFEDRSAVIIPVVYGKDVRDWLYVETEKTPTRAQVAWKGSNARAVDLGTAGVRLYLSSWENPWPDKKLTTIDYSSRKDETVAAPFCVAITIEGK